MKLNLYIKYKHIGKISIRGLGSKKRSDEVKLLEEKYQKYVVMMYRKSELKDLNCIYRLMCDLENKELPFDAFSTIYQQHLDNQNMYCLVCEMNDEIVAMLNMCFEYQLHHCEKIAEVMEFIVRNHYRSQGIGKAMFNQAVEIAKENGCVQIELATNQLRKDAHRFYEREGMSNFHYKFSMRLDENVFYENKVGN